MRHARGPESSRRLPALLIVMAWLAAPTAGCNLWVEPEEVPEEHGPQMGDAGDGADLSDYRGPDASPDGPLDAGAADMAAPDLGVTDDMAAPEADLAPEADMMPADMGRDDMGQDMPPSLCPLATALLFSIDPRGTFLFTDGDRRVRGPTVVDLRAHGLAHPARVKLMIRGGFRDDGSPKKTRSLGLFSSTSQVLPDDRRRRVPGALATSRPGVSTTPRRPKDPPNDIPEDFALDLSPIVVEIPAGAEFLMVAPDDGSPHDNELFPTGYDLLVDCPSSP